MLVSFWFGSGCLVVGGNFGGDLLLNFLIFSIRLSFAGLVCCLVLSVVWLICWFGSPCRFGLGSGFNSTRYFSIWFGLLVFSVFVVCFVYFCLLLILTELSSACFTISGPLLFLSRFLKKSNPLFSCRFCLLLFYWGNLSLVWFLKVSSVELTPACFSMLLISCS